MGGRQRVSSIFNQDKGFCEQRNLASQHADGSDIVKGMARGWSAGLPMGA